MSNQDKKTFNVGEFVFVKLKGYPQWPAIITEQIATKNQTKYKVSFFGDQKTGVVKQTDLSSYFEHKDTFGQLRTENFKNKAINQALREAEIAYSTKQDGEQKNYASGNILKYPVQRPDDNPTSSTQTSQHAEDLDVETSLINDIECKIQNNHDADLETSLTLAAEAGNVLLAENSQLKEDLHRMMLKNSHLAKRLFDSTKLDEMNNYQTQIAELKIEKEHLLQCNITLTETVQQLENQLSKEKELRTQLELIFEEEDQEKEKAIRKYEKEVSQLRETVTHLKTVNNINNNREVMDNKIKNNVETQTNTTSPETTFNPYALQTQLANLKLRQDQSDDDTPRDN